MPFFKYIVSCCFLYLPVAAQVPVNLHGYKPSGDVKVSVANRQLTAVWNAGTNQQARIVLDMEQQNPLIHSLSWNNGKKEWQQVASGLQPVFFLTTGKRDLVSQNGWNIFFDKTAKLPRTTYPVQLQKDSIAVITDGSRTVIRVAGATGGPFSGAVEITLYNGSGLMNIAAVMTTQKDSTAILYDAGLTATDIPWQQIHWADPKGVMKSVPAVSGTQSTNVAVKYRTIIGESKTGSLALFPAPHQFFYPLDNCFNQSFTWYGNSYNKAAPDYGIGIRQEPEGDKRWVPWFNAPPGTAQRLHFFCLLSNTTAGQTLQYVRRYTHSDVYTPLPGYYTMSSHFHQEHTADVLNKLPMPELPAFIKAFRETGVNIVHLGEFHGPGHPRGPESERFLEQQTLFKECERLSTKQFLLLPGEEPNNFFGGHWMNFFPKPVYWVMDRKPSQPFVTNDPTYGKVYRVSNKEEMLQLLQTEKGMAWTAHARTKGSTGFPDKYKEEAFFTAPQFMGAAWKALPADLSQPYLGKRALDLLDDMANWGLHKTMIAEADLFRITPEDELYGHLNVNYLQLDHLPAFKDGWQPVLDAMQQGKFFVTTGEILLPAFTVNGKSSGNTIAAARKGIVKVSASWTFPLNYAVIISGDGKEVYREKIPLHQTQSFGSTTFTFNTNLENRKWVRFELWDVAANGAFTQCVWIK